MTLKQFLVDNHVVVGFAEVRRLVRCNKVVINGIKVTDAEMILKVNDQITVCGKNYAV